MEHSQSFKIRFLALNEYLLVLVRVVSVLGLHLGHECQHCQQQQQQQLQSQPQRRCASHSSHLVSLRGVLMCWDTPSS